MDPLELRANAMLAELKGHINGLVDRCAVMAADNTLLKNRIKELEEKYEPKQKLDVVKDK